MKTIVILIISVLAGLGVFGLIIKKYGSDCIP
jgi:hypothetical protein